MRWESVDPGETVGYASWEDDRLVFAGQRAMWPYLDMLADDFACSGDPPRLLVVEDWILTHNRARRDALAGDKCRTARCIGAIELIARRNRATIVLQPNTVKSRAEAAGAENLFLKPLHENRHANDAIRHGIYYMAVNGVPE